MKYYTSKSVFPITKHCLVFKNCRLLAHYYWLTGSTLGIKFITNNQYEMLQFSKGLRKWLIHYDNIMPERVQCLRLYLMLVYMTFHGHSVFDDRPPLNRQPLPLRRLRKQLLKLLLCIMATTRLKPEAQQTTKTSCRPIHEVDPQTRRL